MTRSAKKLFDLITHLPGDKRQEVLDFVEYLHFKEVERSGLTTQIGEGLRQVKNKKVRPARDLLNDL